MNPQSTTQHPFHFSTLKLALLFVGMFLGLGVLIWGGLWAAEQNFLPKSKLEPNPIIVRVAIARDAQEVDISVDGPFVMTNAVKGEMILSADRLSRTKIRLIDKGIMFGMTVYPVSHMIIQTKKDGAILVNNRRFRGAVHLLRTKNNRLTAVDYIPLEDYVKGVLYHEVSHHWPMETLKAQAVATRTYAIYKMGYSVDNDYDVTNDIYSQVYGGRESERYRTSMAVDRTQDQVLSYKGRILPAYFHASCGGMTEDADQLWEIDLPSLKGVPCMFCDSSPHRLWKRNIRLKEIQDALNARGYQLPMLKTLEVVSRNRSQRINQIRITCRNGKVLLIKGKDFREIIGPNIIKSNNFDFVMQGYYVDIIGKGWGHGVGMCQWGAKGMAEQQFNFRQILNYYYPHSEMVNYHVIADFKQPAATATKSK